MLRIGLATSVMAAMDLLEGCAKRQTNSIQESENSAVARMRISLRYKKELFLEPEPAHKTNFI
jgi:hypothetical protein